MSRSSRLSAASSQRSATQRQAQQAYRPATTEEIEEQLRENNVKTNSDSDESVAFVHKCEEDTRAQTGVTGRAGASADGGRAAEQRSLSMCLSLELSASDFGIKYGAFQFTHNNRKALKLADLDRLAQHIGEEMEADRRRAAKLQTGGFRVKAEVRGAAGNLMRASQSQSLSQRGGGGAFDKASLSAALSATDEMDDLFGDEPVMVKREPASPAKRKAHDAMEDDGEEEHKSGDSARKRAHLDGGMETLAEEGEEDGTPSALSSSADGSASTPAGSAASSATPLQASRSSRPSFPILASSDGSKVQALYPSALGKFAQRTNAGETAVGLNERALARLEPSDSEPSAEELAEAAKRIIEIEVFQPAEDLLAESDEDAVASAAAASAAASAAAAAAAVTTPQSKAAKYSKKAQSAAAGVASKSTGGIDTSIFRYMYQNEDELREALDTNLIECQQIMMDKPEVAHMRTLVRSEAGATAATSLAKTLVQTQIVVKKETEDKKDEGAAAAAPAVTATPPASEEKKDDATVPASATPASSATSTAPAATAAAAAAPIVVDDDEEDQSNVVPLVPVGASKSQQSVLVCGRVVYDSNDTGSSESVTNELVQKLSATHSVWIEGDRSLSAGARIQMRLNGLRSYGLFPGQVVLAKGINASGMSFVAEEIFADASLPHASMPRARVETLNASLGFRPLGLMVAAGPFTTTDDLSFAPLFALLAEAVRVRPDVLLLLGPFVDAEHREISDNFTTVTASYDSLFVRLLGDVMAHLRGLQIKVLVVPSTRDMAALPIFPQPAFDIQRAGASSELLRDVASGRLTLLPNPAMFRLNDVVVGCSSVDVISHLGANNEISKAPPAVGGVEAQGRLQRLASHLLSSHSFYPLFPAPDGVHLDYSHVANLKMHTTPDLLILPSKTRYFAAPVAVGPSGVASAAAPAAATAAASADDSRAPTKPTTIVVNPEYLTKGPSGGTYALISIHPLKDEEMVPTPNSHDRLTDHCMMSRTRVDIIRV